MWNLCRLVPHIHKLSAINIKMGNIQSEKFTKEDARKLSILVYRNIQSNIEIINPLFDTTDESDKFFYGILTRQLCFVTDISCLISNQYVENLTSIFILCRAIIDDYMPLHYVYSSNDRAAEITKLNADAHNKMFKKIADLANLNEVILKGEFPYYPTNEYVNNLKEKTLANTDKDKYFVRKEDFKFKRFHTKRSLIDTYKGNESHADLGRIYFRWRQLSDYVHYSKFSYELDVSNQTIEYQYNDINEFLTYAYYGAKIIMKYFEGNYKVKHIEESQIEILKIAYLSSINNI
jgi:hypothetical protein